MSQSLLTLPTKNERLALLREIAIPFKERANQHDQENSFPFQNIADLKAIDYPAVTIPKEFGGLAISLREMLEMQALIAEMDGSTALAIGWHVGISKNLGESNAWDPRVYANFAKDVVARGALINNAASEPATGSPTRGGRPETTATKHDDGWIINGRKTFTTLSPVLDYFAVSAGIEGSDEVGSFLVRRELSGVSIEETWNSVAMRATGSHDLILNNVAINDEDLVQRLTPGKKSPQGWLLHIPAVYFGIATGAFNYAVNFANQYAPNSLKSGTIAQFPAVQNKIGEMRLKLLESQYLLFGVADRWDSADQAERLLMGEELSAAKVSVVNHAIEIVDLAMRLVGARSISADNPLQRYYRDVRAGLHNPPMEDMVITLLAKNALERQKEHSS